MFRARGHGSVPACYRSDKTIKAMTMRHFSTSLCTVAALSFISNIVKHSVMDKVDKI